MSTPVGTRASAAPGCAVRLLGVVHIYPSPEGDVVALRGVDLDVPPGSALALLGPSGAGKSTVLNLLAGNFPASAGLVRVGDADLGALGADELNRLRATDVSLVVQGAEANLLPYASVAENLWFAQQGARRAVRTEQADLTTIIGLLGLDGLEDRNVEELSASQRQRVALGSGLAPRPRLLLVDEPTSQLDPESARQVIGVLLEACRALGATLVVVTHDPDVASLIGRTVTIRHGRVGSTGHRGREYAVVGHDGSIQLPQDVLEVLPPDSLVEVRLDPDGVRLIPLEDE